MEAFLSILSLADFACARRVRCTQYACTLSSNFQEVTVVRDPLSTTSLTDILWITYRPSLMSGARMKSTTSIMGQAFESRLADVKPSLCLLL